MNAVENPIQFPLKYDASHENNISEGEAVSELHALLGLIKKNNVDSDLPTNVKDAIDGIDAEEISGKQFGVTTQAAIKAFQSFHASDLSDPTLGEVDEQTAKLLDQYQKLYTFKGYAIDSRENKNTPFPSLTTVKLYQKGSVFLTQALVQDNGYFEMAYTPYRLPSSLEFEARIEDEDGKGIVYSNKILDPESAETGYAWAEYSNAVVWVNLYDNSTTIEDTDDNRPGNYSRHPSRDEFHNHLIALSSMWRFNNGKYQYVKNNDGVQVYWRDRTENIDLTEMGNASEPTIDVIAEDMVLAANRNLSNFNHYKGMEQRAIRQELMLVKLAQHLALEINGLIDISDTQKHIHAPFFYSLLKEKIAGDLPDLYKEIFSQELGYYGEVRVPRYRTMTFDREPVRRDYRVDDHSVIRNTLLLRDRENGDYHRVNFMDGHRQVYYKGTLYDLRDLRTHADSSNIIGWRISVRYFVSEVQFIPFDDLSIIKAEQQAKLNQFLDSFKSAMALSDEEELRNLVLKAVQSDYYPFKGVDNLEKYLYFFRVPRLGIILDKTDFIGQSSMRELLALTSIATDPNKLAKEYFVAKIFLEHNARLNFNFYEALSALLDQDFPTDAEAQTALEEVHFVFRVGEMVQGHLPLISHLLDSVSPEEKVHPELLAFKSKEDWLGYIRAVHALSDTQGFPEFIQGADENDKVDNYADVIRERVENKFLTLTVVGELERKQVAFPALGFIPEVKAFFTAHPSLRLKTDSISAYLSVFTNTSGGSDAFVQAGINESKKDKVIEEIQKIQRVIHLSDDLETVIKLLRQGFTSAQSIFLYGEKHFENLMHEEEAMDADQAYLIYQKCKLKYAVVQSQLLEYGEGFNPVNTRIGQDSQSGEVDNYLPDLSSLFGTKSSFCACEPCGSIYSPAAYLVDMLHFLEKRKAIDISKMIPDPDKGGFPSISEVLDLFVTDILLDRRPDLVEVFLNCENSHTEMPYIDLVNEVLEEEVLEEEVRLSQEIDLVSVITGSVKTDLEGLTEPAPVLPEIVTELTTQGISLSEEARIEKIKNTNRWVIEDGLRTYRLYHIPVGPKNSEAYKFKETRQTKLTSQEAKAFPQHVNVVAYDFLKTQTMPWTLPFDLWDVEVNAYLKQLGVDRAELMDVFQNRPTSKIDDYSPESHEIGSIYFGINPALEGLILNDNADLQGELWRIADATTITEMKAMEFLKKTGLIDYAGQEISLIEAIIDTDFIHGNNQTKLSLEKTDPCDIDEIKVVGFDAGVLQRAHRFIRLWTALDYETWELDLLLNSPKIGNTRFEIWRKFFRELQPFHQLQNRYGFGTERLLAFYDAMNTKLHSIKLGGEKKTSLYAEVFLNRSIALEAPAAFEVERLASGSDTLTDAIHRQHVLASLQVSEEDLDLLFKNLPNQELTLNNLTSLYRRVILARFLQKPISELISWLSIWPGVGPFSAPKNTALFIEIMEKFDAMSLSLEEVKYFISNSNEQEGKDDIELADSILAKLAEGYSKLEKKLVEEFPDDPAKKEEEKALLVHETLVDLLGTEFELPGETVGFIIDTMQHVGITLKTHLTDRDSSDFVNQVIATYLADPNSSLKDSYGTEHSAILLFMKHARLVKKLGIAAEELTWLYAHRLGYRWNSKDGMNFANLAVTGTLSSHSIVEEFGQFLSLVMCVETLRAYPNHIDGSFFAVAEEAEKGSPDWGMYKRALSDWLGIEETEIEELNLAFGIPASSLKDLENLQRFLKAFGYSQKLGLKASNLRKISSYEMGREKALIVKQAAKAYYPNEDWLSVSEKIQNEIREQKRDALLSYLTREPKNGLTPSDANYPYRDKNDVYGSLLIDAEMNSEMMTSRLKSALSSVQHFVQRCFLKLEPAVIIDTEPSKEITYDPAWKQWDWMKNYRVWEANRKVFLHPENWIEPELRDDKTPFYLDFENTLLQEEITDENAKKAFETYLQQLDQVSNLEIVGMCEEGLGAGKTRKHVIARTQSSPRVYYHRTWEDESYWTPWKALEAEIEGDHVMPVMYLGKLYLFWLMFIELPESEQKIPPAQADVKSGPPNTYLKIQLSWIRQEEERWSPKNLSELSLVEPFPREKTSYSMQALISTVTKKLYIHLYQSPSESDIDRLEKHKTWYATPDGKYPSKWGDGKALIDGLLTQTNIEHASTFVFDGEVSEVRVLDRDDQFRKIRKLYGEDGQKLVRLNRTNDSQEENNQLVPRKLPISMRFSNNRVVNEPDEPNRKLNVGYTQDGNLISLGVLKDVPFTFDVVMDASSPYLHGEQNFFYQDRRRSFFVVPREYREVETTTVVGQNGLKSETFESAESLGHTFYPHYHPYTKMFLGTLRRDGVKGLLDHEVQENPSAIGGGYNQPYDFGASYKPASLTGASVSSEIVEFDFEGAYSRYNWEVFFHIPFTIACRLSENQRFEEAMSWFHRIFDPTNTGSETSQRKYWITKPFRDLAQSEERAGTIEELIEQVQSQAQHYVKQVNAWLNNAFQPHAIARVRPSVYQWRVVMKYLDNLIDWGDQLFRRDTMESVNEATQIYVLAAEILGPRQINLGVKETSNRQSFDDVEAGIAGYYRTLERYENEVNIEGIQSTGGDDINTQDIPLFQSFFFCIPNNDRLLDYWDVVEDRLFKIRNSLNIEGVKRQLSLFAPPIDPGLLVKAAASGVEVGSLLDLVSVASPHYRFASLLNRAAGFVDNVISLGQTLLSSLEKKDAEELSLLRSSHETAILKLTKEVRKTQIEEAEINTKSLEVTKEMVETRRKYYDALYNENINPGEKEGLKLTEVAFGLHVTSSVLQNIASVMQAIPDFNLGVNGFGGTPEATAEHGGTSLGQIPALAASGISSIASSIDHRSSMVFRLADYKRRREEWEHQRGLAEKELEQIDLQIEASKARQQLAEKELKNIEKQIANSEAVEEHMKSKYTNKELYSWMVSQISSVYFQSYQLAFDMAKRAERAYQYELGTPESTFIDFGYWDSLKKGLLSGEKLRLDLRRMESSFVDLDRRDYELTKQFSLKEMNPMALMQLISTGECNFDVSEFHYDLDHPGHYFRRIKAVSMSIPCVTGPYTGVHATLTLTNSQLRFEDAIGSGYTDASHFRSENAAYTSMATSHGQDDAGVFELNFNDERYLPFEGAGAISHWTLELPKDANYFDFNSISDVVLNIRYTAKPAGIAQLKAEAISNVQDVLPKSGMQCMDLQGSFGGDYSQFLSGLTDGVASLESILSNQHFPFYAQGKPVKIQSVKLIADIKTSTTYTAELTLPQASNQNALLASASLQEGLDENLGGFHVCTFDGASDWSLGSLKLELKMTDGSPLDLSSADIRSMMLLVNYTTS